MRGSRAWIALLVASSLFLAGCTAEDDPRPAGEDEDPVEPGDGNGDGMDDVAAGIAPPTWAVGDHWRYETTFGTSFSLVVVAEDDTHWWIGTDGEDLSWFHHRDEVSYLGAVKKEDLSGSQGTDEVRYFDFPLEAGKNWSTTWDGITRDITIAEAGDSFRFEASEEGELSVIYTYDSAVGWFTEMTFHADGQPAFGMELTDHGANFTGELVRWDAELLFARQGTSGGVTDLPEIKEGTAELWIEYIIDCDDFHGFFVFSANPAGPGEGVSETEECTDATTTLIVEDPEPGQWVVSAYYGAIDPDRPGDQIAAFAYEVWERTPILETIG